MKIGVVLTTSPDSDAAPVPAYTEVREKAQAAEASGLDSIWLYDHLLYRLEPEKTVGVWECWSLLAALAEATNRVELGTLVLCNAFRNPALLAKMAHTLDEVSGGRLLLGVGAGWHEPEFDALGCPFDRRVGQLEESLQILSPLLKGEHVDFVGSHYQVRNFVVTPLGPRPEGIPLLVAAFGPRMLGLAARYADQWNAAWLGQPKELAEGLKLIEGACADVERDPATLGITVGVNVAFPDLGPINTMTENPLSGSAEELAQAFHAYAEAGSDHLIIWHTPSTLPALEQVADAARLYRSGTSG
jgi:probable F420-dependent oxidoreductase